MNAGTVIAISRQYGSGGRELAQILAKKLLVNLDYLFRSSYMSV